MWLVVLTSGMLLLFLLAHGRFDRPRSYTTAFRYFAGLAAYATPSFAIYLLVFLALTGESLAQLAPVAPVSGLQWASVWAALLVAAFLPCMPPLRFVDQLWRRITHRLGGMPQCGLALRQTLLDATMRIPPELASELSVILKRRGYDPQHDALPGLAPLRDRWHKAAALCLILRSWETKRRYRSFIRAAEHDYRALQTEFDRLSFRVTKVSEALHPTPPVAGEACSLETRLEQEIFEVDDEESFDGASKRVLREGLREDVDGFLDDVCLFVARGVLSVRRTASGRFQALRTLGFNVPMQPRFDRLLAGFVCVVLVTTIFFAWRGLEDRTLPLLIAGNYIVALAVAAVPKLHATFANRNLLGRLPYTFFASAGVAAVLASLPGVLLRKRYLGQPLDWRLDGPWLLPTFVTAVVAAVLVQDSIWSPTDSMRRQRLKDGLALGLGLAVSTVLVMGLLRWTGGRVPSAQAILSSFINGFLLGWLVPWSFRAAAAPRKRVTAAQPAKQIELGIA